MASVGVDYDYGALHLHCIPVMVMAIAECEVAADGHYCRAELH
jgi:hypothetical protein